MILPKFSSNCGKFVCESKRIVKQLCELARKRLSKITKFVCLLNPSINSFIQAQQILNEIKMSPRKIYESETVNNINKTMFTDKETS